MNMFDKSLQAVTTLDSVITTANETFRAERKRLTETYVDPSKELGALREELNKVEAEQKERFREIVKAEFAAVRGNVNKVVTIAPPADFVATLEAIKASGKAITKYEAEAFLEKYKSNYLAYRTIAEVLKQAGQAENVHVVYPDKIMNEIEEGETMLLNWCNNYGTTAGSSYMTALLQNHNNPIIALASFVNEFLNGRFELEEA